MPTLSILNDDLKHGRQGWTREQTVEIAGHKVRATLYRDSYDFQSDIHVDVLTDALTWSRLQTLSGVDFADVASAYEKSDDAILRSSEPVIQRLLGYAELVLS